MVIVLFKAVGRVENKYRRLMRGTNNKNLEDVIDDIKKNSRHFAKRQYTFFNHQFNTNWFEVDLNNFSNTINEVINFLKKF